MVAVRRGLVLAAFVTASLAGLLDLPAARAQVLQNKDLFQFDLAGDATPTAAATVAATLTADAAKPDEAVLAITVTLPDGAVTYGQDDKAQKKTEIKIRETVGLSALDEKFSVDRAPEIVFEKVLNREVGKYHDSVTFSRRYRIDSGVAAEKVKVDGSIDFLFCDDKTCTPQMETFAAALTKAAASEASAETPVAPNRAVVSEDPLKWGYRIVPTRRSQGKMVPDPVRVQFELKPAAPKKGDKVTLSITMQLDKNWHTYSLHPGKKQIELPTEISLGEINGLETAGDWRETPKSEVRETPEGISHLFSHQVTWEKEFTRTDAAALSIEGELTYQICEEGVECKPQKTLPFALGEGQPSELVKDAKPPVAIAAVTPARGGPEATLEVESDGQAISLGTVLLLSFLGGLTLNIMPCVLPVLAIKILSFVQQAGESRARILTLNLVYSLGVVSVFWALASLAAFFSVSWGGLFQEEWFRVGMVLILFTLGLNMLGVFEVVLPGVINQAAGSGHREGLPGAFLTGIFATLLATPCSTAYMGTALAWSFGKPSAIIYLVWTVMGLGMAFPYLIVGCIPQLVDALPRPGMWMVRFKQLSAFALFAAAVFFTKSVDQRNVLPLLYATVGIGLALWMIGAMYDHASSFATKSKVRIAALLFGGGICFYAWSLHIDATMPTTHHLPWKAFREDTLLELRTAGKPALIDFTADWCLICKTNERIALNTEQTAKYVKDKGIVTLVADWTNKSEEIRTWLNKFGRDSVPLTVIVPPNPEAKLIVLAGAYSQGQLLAKLDEAMNQAKPAVAAVPAQPAGEPSKVAAASP